MVGRILAILWSMPPMLRGRRRCVEALPDKVSFHVLLGLTDIFWLAQVPPVVFVGAESQKFFALRGQPQIRGHNGENAFFREQRKYPRRDEDRKSTRLNSSHANIS